MKRNLTVCFMSLLFLAGTILSAQATDELHIHRYSKLYTVKPTCTEYGYTYYFCSCGESYSSDKTEAYGHTFSNDYILIKEPTCTEKGVKARYCLSCFAADEEMTVEKIAHKAENVILKATTETDGEKRISCAYCGQIYKREIIPAVTTVSLNKSVFRFNNKTNRPSVKIIDRQGNTLINGSDYSLAYASKSKKPGEYTVTITFTGLYEGKKSLKYTIIPENVKKFTAEPSTRTVYLSWNKVKDADGYAIYLYKKKSKKYILIRETDNLYYTVSKTGSKRINYGTDYCFAIKAFKNTKDGKIYSDSYKKVSVSTKPSKAYLKSCKYSSGSINLRWKKQSCDGYEIVYATNKSFSSERRMNIASDKAVSKKLKNIKNGKTYFFKIRAYKIFGGERMYGYYSNILEVRS